MPELSPVVITAAGEGSRISQYMVGDLGLPPDYPKHLLQTGTEDETLLGRIVNQATGHPLDQPPIVGVNEKNAPFIRSALEGMPVVYDETSYVFSMDRIYYRLAKVSAATGALTLGCAGDFYSDFTWQEMLDQHRQSGAAMSLLVQRSPEEVRAAVFNVDDQTGRITSVERPEVSQPGSYTNVGVYVIGPTDDVLRIMHDLLPDDPRDCKDDDSIFKAIVAAGLAGAVEIPGCYSINVNTPREYQQLLDHTSQIQDALAD